MARSFKENINKQALVLDFLIMENQLFKYSKL